MHTQTLRNTSDIFKTFRHIALVPATLFILPFAGCGGNGNNSAKPPTVPVASTTSLAATPTTAVAGTPVAFTATVSTASGSSVPTGSVAFSDGAASLGSTSLDATGKAALSITTLAAGVHLVTAAYGGSLSVTASTSVTVTINITQTATIPTTTTLSTSPATVSQGLPVELTATTVPAFGIAIPTGTITFRDGSSALGSSSLDITGRAILTTTLLAPGSHAVTASYGGDATNGASQSAASPLTIQTPSGTTFTNPLKLNVTGLGTAVSCADPAILKTNMSGHNTWFLYCTSDALTAADTQPHYINVFESTDLVNWNYDGNAFTGLPAWAPNGALWAPAIKYFNGQYYLYYATPETNLAGNGSAIGVGVSNSPKGPFVDHGSPVVEPQPATNCCAGGYRSTIDPDEIQDTSGQRYLLFGSFAGGIYVRKLSADGFTSDNTSEQLIATDNRYEGGNWWYHNGYYYLFASSTNCCNGPFSGYSVFVARATNPTGPYLDAQGNSLTSLNPGGTVALAMNGNGFVGPGGNVIFTDEAGVDYILYHAIPLSQSYYPGLGSYTARPALMDAIDWVNDWPVTRGGYGPSGATAPQPIPAAQPGMTNAYVNTLNSNDTPGTLLLSLSDDFNSSALSPQWSFLHGTALYTLTGSSYAVQTVNFDTIAAPAQVPELCEPAPPTDYVVETKLSLNLPLTGSGNNFAQAGLLLYGDDNNSIRLDLYSNSDTRQIEFINQAAPQSAGFPSWGATNLGPPQLSSTVNAVVRIVKRTVNGEETYTGYSSMDGTTWTRGGTWKHSLGSSARVCLYAGNRSGFTANFDYVHVSTLQ